MSDGFVGSVRLFHASGVQVTLPLGKSQDEYKHLYASVDAMLASGFLTAEPGMQVGENKDMIGSVARREKVDERGTTPVIDMYINHEKMVHSFLTIYLNTPQDIDAFEASSGLKLNSIKLYAGDNRLEKGTPKGNQYLANCPRPFEAVWIPNPKYNKEEADSMRQSGKMYTIPARKFVRFGGAVAASTGTPATNPQPASRQPAPQQQQNHGSGFDYNDYVQHLEDSASMDVFQSLVDGIRPHWKSLNQHQQADFLTRKKRKEIELNDPIPF